jgi:hypothetical protein
MTNEFIGRGFVSRMVDISPPKWLTYLYVSLLGLAYVIVAVHTPISLYPDTPHDDGLFIRLGGSLAEGRWLGGFNQFTLMKGPGYPAFLALANWLGVSVSIAHALFHCFAVTFFVAICHRFTKSYLISSVLLTLLLWHPASLTVLRVIRDKIYYDQTLLVLGTMLWILFGPLEATRRLLWAGVAGAILGWFWLTREEGIWIVPGLVFLLLVASLHVFRQHRVRELAVPLFVVIGIFGATQLGFSSVNGLVYGKFVGVDVKEANFRRALGALDSVRSGGTKPFVSITHAAMQRVYAASPAFASLAPYFNEPGTVDAVCRWEPDLCGEIGGGWFMWALRDAAAARGHYTSPTEASRFFGRVADEVSIACRRGKLECQPQLIPEMPPITWPDVWKRLLPRSIDAFNLLLLRNPAPQLDPSIGGEELLQSALRFLNYPLRTRSLDVPSEDTYMLSGGYLNSGSDWISAEMVSPKGATVSFHFDRRASPDIQKGLDPLASDQRFMLQTRCSDDCTLVLRAPTGEVVEKRLGDYRKAPIDIDLGTGRVHVDSAIVVSDPQYAATKLDRICAWLRIAILAYYCDLFLPILALGLVALIASAFTLRGQAAFNVCFVMAVACWGLVLSRTALLLLIDITSFRALFSLYLAPAYYLLVAAAVLSIAVWTQLGSNRQIPLK